MEVKFTLTNTSHRVLSGTVEGYLDQTPLHTHQVQNLAHGVVDKGALTFSPLTADGHHVLTILFREPRAGKAGTSVGVVLAFDKAGYIAADSITIP
jgi:hypothetical protein